jgi:hypothetical protein
MPRCDQNNAALESPHRAPGRGVRVVSSGSVGLVLSGPQRTAERVDCRSESASLQAADDQSVDRA